MDRLTKEQAAIIGAYTGFMAGPFAEMHEYIEKIMRRPVMTHEMGNKKFAEEISKKAKKDFLRLCREE